MKPSGVTRGFKWLADKIHPQLPLDTKESQRLLTVLNSSFRRHLDKAHPAVIEHERERNTTPSQAGSARGSRNNPHSSAHSLADKHLASVLTNPLFVRNSREKSKCYAAAKIELAKNLKGPIQLLEEYHKTGAATVPIAELCLETIHRELLAVPAEERSQRIKQDQPGRRTLVWLLESTLSDASSYVEQTRFIELLIHFLLLENCEEKVWKWITLDLALPGSAPRDRRKQEVPYKYKWRGRILRAMITSKLGYHDNHARRATTDGVHAAIDILRKACDIKQAAPPGHHLSWLGLAGPAMQLHQELTHGHQALAGLDEKRYDFFTTNFPLYFEGKAHVFIDMLQACLDLFRPRRPSGDRALHCIRAILSEPNYRFAKHFFHVSHSQRSRWSHMMIRTIFLLREDGHEPDADWLESVVRKEYPEHVRELESKSKIHVQGAGSAESDISSKELEMPFTVFA